MGTVPEETSPTRWSLVKRLKDWDDQESWRSFFNTYWRLIYAAARQSGLTDSEAQEVVQETVITVAKRMSSFNTDPSLGSFRNWLLQVTKSRIIDQLRKRPPPGRFQVRQAQSEDPDRTATVERVPDPESLQLDNRWNQEWRRNLLDAAVESVKQKVNPRQYKIFYLHVVKKLPSRQVADALGVNLAQVYLAKSRVSALVKREVRRLEKRMI